MLEWFTLIKKKGGNLFYHLFIYFYSVTIVTPVILDFVSCALILSIVV